jgi:hypothetical protein
MLNNWRVSIPDGADVLSLYQEELMKREKHNFQKHAHEMLEMMGVEVPIGGNVLSIYQKELMAMGVHPWQVHARKMLNDRGIHIPDDADVLSIHQEELMKREKHNFQVYARKMLAIMGVEVPIDGNVISIYQKAQYDLGLSPLQNLSEESEDKRLINLRLSKMAKELPKWKKSFKGFCTEFPKGKPCPTNGKSTWFKHQKAADRGIKDRAEFEASHMNEEWLNQWNAKNEEQLTGEEWRNNRVEFNRVTMDRWKKEF